MVEDGKEGGRVNVYRQWAAVETGVQSVRSESNHGIEVADLDEPAPLGGCR